jgi:hypothetical protein
MTDQSAESELIMSSMYIGTFYSVSDEGITQTGKRERYWQPTRQMAIDACLYTHKLHNGNASASKNGVIDCPTCGQIAITKE